MRSATSISRTTAIVGIGETAYTRGTDRHVCDLVLGAAMEAITDAGMTPTDVNGIIPSPSFISSEEIASHLGIPEVRYAISVLMGGVSPTAPCRARRWRSPAAWPTPCWSAWGGNGYSALQPRPDARPTTRTMNVGPMGETVRNHYAPYG